MVHQVHMQRNHLHAMNKILISNTCKGYLVLCQQLTDNNHCLFRDYNTAGGNRHGQQRHDI
jgi:hypothetical protein